MDNDKSKGKGIVLSCGVCHRYFRYDELIIEPSWNGKYLCYRTPCCKSEQWMTRTDMARPDKYLFFITHDAYEKG